MLISDRVKSLFQGRYVSVQFVGVAIVYVALFLLLPFASDFPLNDDWVYTQNVVDTIANGRYTVTGFELAWGFPQVLIGILVTTLFGFSFEILRAVNLVFGIGVLWFCSRYLRILNVSKTMHFLVLLSVLLFPPFFVLGITFMTDMAFLFFWIGTCYFWEKAFRQQTYGDLFLGAIFCILAIAQRQFGIFLAVGAGMLLMMGIFREKVITKRTILFITSLVVIVIATAIMYWYWKLISPVYSPTFLQSLDIANFAKNMMHSIVYLAFIVLPVSFVLFRRKHVDRFRSFFAGKKITIRNIILVSFCMIPLVYMVVNAILYDRFMPYIGNMISQWGFFRPKTIMPGVREKIIQDGSAIIMLFVSIAAFLMLFLIVVNFLRKDHFRLSGIELKKKQQGNSDFYRLGFFSVLSSLLCVTFICLRGVLFDRYLLPFLICFIIVFSSLHHKESIRRYIVAFALILCMGALNFALVSDYFSWNAARWKAVRWLESSGTDVNSVDGGYEWFGWRKREFRAHVLNRKYMYVISFSPLPGYRVLGSFPYKTFFPNRLQYVHVLISDKTD